MNVDAPAIGSWKYARYRARRSWAPSPLRRIVRHRAFRLLVCGAALAWAWNGLDVAMREAQDAAASWGSSRTVLVVAQPIAAGELLAGHVEPVERPVAMTPPEAVESIDETMRASVDLVPGELVLASRVVGSGDGLLPAGTLAVAVEVSTVPDHVAPGDLVDLWAAAQVAIGAAERVLHAVVVIESGEGVVTVAVDEGDVGRLARFVDHELMLARRG